MTDLSQSQQAAAFHGLAINQAVAPQERLAFALQALDLYEAEVERMQAQLDEECKPCLIETYGQPLRLDPDNPRTYVDAGGMRVVNADTVTALRERDRARAEVRAAHEELDVNDKAWRAERDTLLAQLEKTCATLMREERAHADTIASLDKARSLAYIGELAIAYVDTPDGSDETEQAYHELDAAIRHMRAVDAREFGRG